MADLTPTVSSVAWVSGGVSREYNSSTTITAGMSVYLTSSNTWAKAGATTATLAGSGSRVGVALHAALSGQPLAVQESGVINLGATLAVGTLYYVSRTAGLICLISDLVSTDKINILGLAITTANLDMAYKQAYTAGYTAIAVP